MCQQIRCGRLIGKIPLFEILLPVIHITRPMEKSPQHRLKLIGRDKELNLLKDYVEDAIVGKGTTILISGEAGVGKTRLVEEFIDYSANKTVRVLTGSTASDYVHPFLLFSNALENEIDKPLFQEQEYSSFTAVFAVNKSGILLAQDSSDAGNLDADIFAGMLSAVQNFVRDSLGGSEELRTGLGRLEYGNMKILIEYGSNIFLVAVLKGNEHPNMKNLLKFTIRNIEDESGDILQSWAGNMADVAPIQNHISTVAIAKFLVRRDMEGVKLENERIKIADEVLEILKSLSREEPIILLLEDIHWADESSIFVLNYLARNIVNEKILTIGTLRPEMSDIVRTTVEKMTQEGNVSLMPLIRLGVDCVSSLVESMFPVHKFSDSFIENLADSCQGNPFFVIELLRQMKEEGNISISNGNYVLISQDYSIPILWKMLFRKS